MSVRVRVDFGTGFDLEYPGEIEARDGIERLAAQGIAAAVITSPRTAPLNDQPPGRRYGNRSGPPAKVLA